MSTSLGVVNDRRSKSKTTQAKVPPIEAAKKKVQSAPNSGSSINSKTIHNKMYYIIKIY